MEERRERAEGVGGVEAIGSAEMLRIAFGLVAAPRAELLLVGETASSSLADSC